MSPDAFIFDYDLELAPREKPSRIKGKVTLAFMSKVDTEIVGTSVRSSGTGKRGMSSSIAALRRRGPRRRARQPPARRERARQVRLGLIADHGADFRDQLFDCGRQLARQASRARSCIQYVLPPSSRTALIVRAVAHRLAPLLDRKWVYPVAIAAASTIREDTSRVPMLLKLYSTEANRVALG